MTVRCGVVFGDGSQCENLAEHLLSAQKDDSTYIDLRVCSPCNRAIERGQTPRKPRARRRERGEGDATMNEKDFQLSADLKNVVETLQKLRTLAAAEAITCVCGRYPQPHDPAAPCAKHAQTRASIQAAITTLEQAIEGLRKD